MGDRGSHVGRCAGVMTHAGVARREPGRQGLGHVLAEQRLAADCLQPSLRCGFRQQLKAGVRLRLQIKCVSTEFGASRDP